MNMEENSTVNNVRAAKNVDPADLKAKFDAKLAEIRQKQNRVQTTRTEEEQAAIRLDYKIDTPHLPFLHHFFSFLPFLHPFCRSLRKLFFAFFA